MSLLDNFMTSVCFMEKARTADGEGGFSVEWTEGATFSAAIVRDSSMQAKIAEKQGVTSTWTVTTSKSIKLEYHDVIKRISDGVIFRVTSNGDEKTTPSSSSLDINQVTAERWELT